MGRSLVMEVGPRGMTSRCHFHYRLHYLAEMKRKNYRPLLDLMDRMKMSYLVFGNWQEALG